MTKYTAVFSNGQTATKTSTNRAYAYAWRAWSVRGTGNDRIGFSATRAGAVSRATNGWSEGCYYEVVETSVETVTPLAYK